MVAIEALTVADPSVWTVAGVAGNSAPESCFLSGLLTLRVLSGAPGVAKPVLFSLPMMSTGSESSWRVHDHRQ